MSCRDLHDTIGMLARKLLFDAGAVRKSRQNNCLHDRDSRRGH